MLQILCVYGAVFGSSMLQSWCVYGAVFGSFMGQTLARP